MTDPVMTAEKLRPLARSLGKPVLASWMGGSSVAAGRSILSGAGIPIFDYPDQAVEAFLYMWRYSITSADCTRRHRWWPNMSRKQVAAAPPKSSLLCA
jgi:acetyltransferase